MEFCISLFADLRDSGFFDGGFLDKRFQFCCMGLIQVSLYEIMFCVCVCVCVCERVGGESPNWTFCHYSPHCSKQYNKLFQDSEQYPSSFGFDRCLNI